MTTSFASLFLKATGKSRYDFQERFADEFHDLLPVPTGGGKTATVVLGWLHRRRFADDAVKKATPRRLVYCLPMRTLVEQTAKNAEDWLKKLDLTKDVGVHKLLGGDTDDDWALHPERDAVLVGTQDMLLSRALDRGFAQGRFRWPIDFGLLNNDCVWVFDEVQLMASGLTTSAQLAGMRAHFSTFGPACKSVWASATMDPAWLGTIDHRPRLESLTELKLTDEELIAGELGKRMQAKKTLRRLEGVSASDNTYAKDLARAVCKEHEAGRLTLVVLNVVDRAKAVYEEIKKLKVKADLLLIHSRYRPEERKELNRRLNEKPDPSSPGRIVVATQVIEAGVDISARALFTELGPWPSIVQRLGRCHREGEFGDDPGKVFWIGLDEAKSAAPYEKDHLVACKKLLEKLEGKDASPLSLRKFQKDEGVKLAFDHKHVLRRRDLLDLFDTAPDLSGNDVDVSRYVRGDDPETDVSVFWREFDAKKKPSEYEKKNNERIRPRREELCPVPIDKMRDFLEADDVFAYRKDHIDDEWVRVRSNDVRPGMTLLLSCDAGGYDWDETKGGVGWCGDRKKRPEPVTPRENPKPTPKTDAEEGVGADLLSETSVRTLVEHTDEVCAELKAILAGIDLPKESADELRHAARWHDLGKAHPVFQASMRRANSDLDAGRVWAKSGKKGRLRHVPKHFRHELASALAMLGAKHSFLSAYLVAAHHGRVRLGIRSVPGDAAGHVLGVKEGDAIPATDLGDESSHKATLSLKPMCLGRGSWGEQALKLLAEYGPFRLAYLEALLRAADLRASAAPKTEVTHE